MERNMVLTHTDYLSMKKKGGLVVVVGPMCAGKSTVLADIVFFAANTDTIFNHYLLVCPNVDTRTQDVMNPREDDRCYAIRKVSDPSEIIRLAQAENDPPYSILIIDEAHFFDSDQLVKMVRALRGPNPHMLIVLGMLDRRADGKFWPVYRDMVTHFRLNVLDGNLIILAASCDVDGRTCVIPATHTYFEGDLPVNGICPGASLYHPMCETHWELAQKLGWSPKDGFGSVS